MRKKTIGLITYDHPHLKTERVVLRLLARGFLLRIYALPFVERKPRKVLFEHRPDQKKSIHPRILAETHNIPYMACESDTDIDDACDLYFIIAGKILSAECVARKRILNCHPGIIPAVRGLDAFKWAILEKKPLGITLHFIDKEVDKGEIVSIVVTPVYTGDALEALARRHYENELEVQCSFDKFLENPENDFNGIAEGEAHRRMGSEDEAEMIRVFDEYVCIFSEI